MIVSTIAQGFLWAVLGFGIYLTFRILNFPDLTTEKTKKCETLFFAFRISFRLF